MKHLVLVGRRGLSTPGAESAVKEIEGLGSRVTVATADVTDRDALARVLAAIPPDLPLRIVVHSAFVLDDGMFTDQTPERFRAVMAPKVVGGWNLHELTAKSDLDAFILFSSVAGTLGNAAQGPYCAANVCVDALAAHRRAQGLPAASLAWGPWAEVGLAAGLSAQLQARLAEQGFVMIQPKQGMALFDQALGRPEAELVIAPLDLKAAARTFGASVPAVWKALIRAKSARVVAAADGSWTSEIAALPPEARLEAVTQTVRAEVARVLALGRATAVPTDRPMRELGLDSLMAVELRNSLGRRVGVTLPANLAFAHPTPTAIARYLVAEVPSLAGSGAGDAVPSAAKENGVSQALAPRSDEGKPANALAVAPPPAPRAPVPMAQAADSIERIPLGERWLADGFRVIPTPGGFAQLAVDMTQATAALGVLAEGGLQASFTHVLVRAAAIALARNPRLHQSVSGYRKVTPGSVDIGLSMVGQTNYAPVVVLPAVDRIPLPALIGVIESATAAARLKETEDLQKLREIGWLTPFGFLRRFGLRIMQRSFSFRRKLVGTFQITTLPTVDVGVPLQFYSGSILSFGRVRASAVAVDGRIEVRPMLLLTIGVEPVSMDAVRASALVGAIAAVLESGELVEEARGALASGGPALPSPVSDSPPALPPASSWAVEERRGP
jgi:acyl carrier protein